MLVLLDIAQLELFRLLAYFPLLLLCVVLHRAAAHTKRRFRRPGRILPCKACILPARTNSALGATNSVWTRQPAPLAAAKKVDVGGVGSVGRWEWVRCIGDICACPGSDRQRWPWRLAGGPGRESAMDGDARIHTCTSAAVILGDGVIPFFFRRVQFTPRKEKIR